MRVTPNNCADAPVRMEFGQVVVIDGCIYYGGGTSDVSNEFESEGDYYIQCYEESSNVWSTLPMLPICWFGMGSLNGELVTVGGQYEDDCYEIAVTNACFVYCEDSQTWEQSIQPMPTARESPSVISYKSYLIVAGGCICAERTNAVEIYNSDTSQWNATQGLPSSCTDISATIYNDKVFLLGGRRADSTYTCVSYSAVIDELIPKSTVTKQTSESVKREMNIWKTLPNPPAYHSSMLVLSDMIVALGGKNSQQDSLPTKCLFAYSLSADSWIYIGDLPCPVLGVATVPLSSAEFFVVGGIDENGDRISTAQKFTCFVSTL